ncbi:hypothetical protein [Massilia yuzhufengensis]|uniref:Uncharacterized protein n=1 Tax=Massilia yuzhufengensis TaxID=1164594 RepID=A0A1I1WD48_9BURK|nr:hypothetical protein [Massilia yuzhufengensis]SFD93064.1 hypothetical protein SAMN05216204_14626 [Massilia yuzhufengensis]
MSTRPQVVIDPRQQQVSQLDEAGRHAEALALLQELYAEAEAEPAPERTRYFMTMFQWKMLTENYPPASTALAAVRDDQATRFLAGEMYSGSGGDNHGSSKEAPWQRVSRFSLIVDMNRTLADPRATHALFLQLEAASPELARRHAWQALPDIVAAGDFTLADRYRRDPLALLGDVKENARSMPLFPPPGQAPRLSAELSNLAGDVRVGIAVLRGLGRAEEADALRAALLAGLPPGQLRDLAERELDERGTIHRALAAHQMTLEDRDTA